MDSERISSFAGQHTVFEMYTTKVWKKSVEIGLLHTRVLETKNYATSLWMEGNVWLDLL